MLFACGLNKDGQCAVVEERLTPMTPKRSGTDSPTMRPDEPASLLFFRQIPSTTKFKSISAGSRHTLALSESGLVFAWGWGLQGQLGLGHFNTVLQPTRIETLNCVVEKISAGGIHSACLDSQGQCYTWGSSEYGQLGLGPYTAPLQSPALVNGEALDVQLRFSSISCGGMHTAAIDLEGGLWCWGRADSGQTGSGKWVFDHFPGLIYPKQILGVTNVIQVCCGAFHTVVLTASGNVLAMGKEDFGILGTDIEGSGKMKAGTETLTELPAFSGKVVAGISCGGWHSMFWTQDGELYACGKGEYGRLGVGSEKNLPTPTLVRLGDGNVKVAYASCGGSHSLILSTSGEVYAVGRGDDGRLGLGPITNPKVLVPVPVVIEIPVFRYKLGAAETRPPKILQVAAGGGHSIVLIDSSEMRPPSFSGDEDSSNLVF